MAPSVAISLPAPGLIKTLCDRLLSVDSSKFSFRLFTNTQNLLICWPLTFSFTINFLIKQNQRSEWPLATFFILNTVIHSKFE